MAKIYYPTPVVIPGDVVAPNITGAHFRPIRLGAQIAFGPRVMVPQFTLGVPQLIPIAPIGAGFDQFQQRHLSAPADVFSTGDPCS